MFILIVVSLKYPAFSTALITLITEQFGGTASPSASVCGGSDGAVASTGTSSSARILHIEYSNPHRISQNGNTPR
jgi:hypothetical protein